MNIVGLPPGKTGLTMSALPTQENAFTRCADGTSRCRRSRSESFGPVKNCSTPFTGGTSWAAETGRLDALRREQRLGSILALHHAGRGAAFLGGLLRAGEARKVFASAREGYLRVAFHGWHDEATVARVAEWLRAAA